MSLFKEGRMKKIEKKEAGKWEERKATYPFPCCLLRLLSDGVTSRAGERHSVDYEEPLCRREFDLFSQVKGVSSVHELNGDFKPLQQFPPGRLEVDATVQRHDTLQFGGTDTHADACELPSTLRFY